MNPKIEEGITPTIFLAMFWGGGGPYTLKQIIHVYDWINRDIPSRSELESALNTLLAMKLVEKHGEKYQIPQSQGVRFDAFRKKKRKSKFVAARLFFKQFGSIPDPLRAIRISEEEYQRHLKDYRRSFE